MTFAAHGGDREGSIAPRPPGAVHAQSASRAGRRITWSPERIVVVYAVVSFVWIAFSDRAVEMLVHAPFARQLANTAKGTLFVLATAVLLYALIRRAQGESRALAAELRATVDSMADAVLLVESGGRIVDVNRAALDLLGARSKAEVIGDLEAWGRRYALRTPDGTPIPFERYASMRALYGESARYDAVLRRTDGRDVAVSVAAAPVVIRGGRPLAVSVLHDVSEARRLDELRDEFLSTAAHEFKTPLAVVKAYAQLMQRRDAGDPHALDVIQRQVNRLSRLVQRLLVASRLREGATRGGRERVDVAALAREVVDEIRPAAPSHDLRVEGAASAPVLAEREGIARVLASLVENAVRFSPDGGPVRAHVEVADGEVRVAVEDRGVGIPVHRQERIFERYYRAHAGTPHDYGGLGVGLEVSRAIVQVHGGRMWFESAPGVGSTFHFTLPLAPGSP